MYTFSTSFYLILKPLLVYVSPTAEDVWIRGELSQKSDLYSLCDNDRLVIRMIR